MTAATTEQKSSDDHTKALAHLQQVATRLAQQEPEKLYGSFLVLAAALDIQGGEGWDRACETFEAIREGRALGCGAEAVDLDQV